MKEAVRLDQYLDRVCLFKTRSAAANAIDAGEVRIDGEKPKVAHRVRQGEVIEIRSLHRVVEVEVLDTPAGRISKQDAHRFYRVRKETRTDAL